MKKIFITLLTLCFSSVIFCEDFLGIRDFRFGMSKDEVLQKEMQCEEDYHSESEFVPFSKYGLEKKIKLPLSKREQKERERKFSSSLNYCEESYEKHKILDGIDFEYNKYNESMKYYKGFYYLGQYWRPVFKFVDGKLYEIELSFFEGKVADIFDNLEMFYDKYQITGFETNYEYNEQLCDYKKFLADDIERYKYKVKYGILSGINEKNNNTITIRHNVFEENLEYFSKAVDFYPILVEITFHSDIPEYIEFKNQEEQKKLKQQQEEKLKEEKRKQKIYNGL